SQDSLAGIRYSPDGKYLLAGSYPGGVVSLWDVASGRLITEIEAGKGLRGSSEYFFHSSDWKTLVTSTNTKPDYERFQRDGETLQRNTYHDAVQVWSLETGVQLANYQHSPARGYRGIFASPRLKWLFSFDDVPGEFAGRPRALSLWDMATG